MMYLTSSPREPALLRQLDAETRRFRRLIRIRNAVAPHKAAQVASCILVSSNTLSRILDELDALQRDPLPMPDPQAEAFDLYGPQE